MIILPAESLGNPAAAVAHSHRAGPIAVVHAHAETNYAAAPNTPTERRPALGDDSSRTASRCEPSAGQFAAAAFSWSRKPLRDDSAREVAAVASSV